MARLDRAIHSGGNMNAAAWATALVDGTVKLCHDEVREAEFGTRVPTQ